jgi:hypothetical protein
LISCPDWTRTLLRNARDRCYSAIVHENVFSRAVSHSTTSSRQFEAGAAWKDARILCNTCSGISRNLKELRSGAIRVGGGALAAL